MLALDLRIAFHIGDGPRDLQYPVMSACAQALLLHGAFQHSFAFTA